MDWNTYDRILCAINAEDSEYALRILQWLTFSSWPLSVEEISEVIAIDPERDPAFNKEEVLEDPLEVLNICSSLINIPTTEDPFENSVALSHYSVKEYLISERIRRGPAARYSMQANNCHEFIAKSCLGYLLQFQEPNSISNKSVERSRLARYSAMYWITHAQAVPQKAESLNRLIMELFSTESGAYLNWIWIHDPDNPYADNCDYGPNSILTPLYYASLSGLTEIVRLLTLKSKCADINAYEGSYGNALQAASCNGHLTTAELLLEKGANVNAQGGHFGYALQAASQSFRGHLTIIELLLSKGADINAQGGNFGSALQAASYEGSLDTVKVLLSKGADVNAHGGQFGSALWAAFHKNRLAIVELLIHNGFDFSNHEKIQAALCRASEKGYNAIVKILLGKGAKINTQGGYSDTALQAASRGGHLTTVKLLLENGADVNAPGGYSGNALYAASYRGHTAVVELLLHKGADANAQEECRNLREECRHSRGRWSDTREKCVNALQAASY